MEKGAIVMNKYEIIKMVGKGNFAKVYRARNIKTGEIVAIKMIEKEKVKRAGMMDQIKREISIMKMVNHPNIVKLYEVLATKSYIYFVMEYVKGGELFNKISRGRLKEDSARRYFQQLVSAVDYCHRKGVYHRDLKPENLLLDEFCNLKVADFGLSIVVDADRRNGLLQTTCGTPAYAAPEVLNRKGYEGAKADIWSCGVILFVLRAGFLPFNDMHLMEMYRKVSRGEFKYPGWFSSEIRELISKMLDPNPASRITLSEIMDNHWFKKGFEGRPIKTETEAEKIKFDADETFESDDPDPEKLSKARSLTAFDIISLSSGCDLSGLFVNANEKEDSTFSSTRSAPDIMSKIEEISDQLQLKVKKKKDNMIKLEGLAKERKRPIEVEVEIYEFASSFHLVEIRKSSGDALEYQELLKNGIRPALTDIVTAWHGEHHNQQPVLAF